MLRMKDSLAAAAAVLHDEVSLSELRSAREDLHIPPGATIRSLSWAGAGAKSESQVTSRYGSCRDIGYGDSAEPSRASVLYLLILISSNFHCRVFFSGTCV